MTITAALRGRRLWPRRAAMLVCLVIAAMLVAPGLAAAQPPAPPPPPGQPGPTTPPPNPLVPSDPQTAELFPGNRPPDPFSGCAPAPRATGPVSGLAGSLDPGVLEPRDIPADGFDPYGEYGYGGLTWSTYDLGCGGAIRDPAAAIDTMFGNMFLGLAKDLFAAQVAVQNLAEDPAASRAVNEAARNSGITLNDAVFSPWSGAALVVAGTFMMILARKGDIGAILTRAGLVLVAITIATLSYGPGAQLSEQLSGTVRAALDEVEDTVAQRSFPNAAAGGADYGMRNVVYRELLWQSWKDGMVGAAGSPDLAQQLFEAQALTRDEWARMVNGSNEEQETILKEKGTRWKQLADNEARPSEVQNIQGRGDSRTAAGAVALFKLLPIAVLQIFGSLIKYMMFLFLAFLPAVAPLVALIAIVKHDVPEKSVKVVGSVIVAGVVASVVTLLHTLLVLYITNEGINNWSMILLCWVSAIVLYKFMKPITSLGGILASIHGATRRVSSTSARTARWIKHEYRHHTAAKVGAQRHLQLISLLGAALRRDGGGGDTGEPTTPAGGGRPGGGRPNGGGGPSPKPRGGPGGGPQPTGPRSGPRPDTGGGPRRGGAGDRPANDQGTLVRLPAMSQPAPATALGDAPSWDAPTPGAPTRATPTHGTPTRGTSAPGVSTEAKRSLVGERPGEGGRVRAGRAGAADASQRHATAAPRRGGAARADGSTRGTPRASIAATGHDGAELGSIAVAGQLLSSTARRPGLYRPTRSPGETRLPRRPAARRSPDEPARAANRGRHPELGDRRQW